MQTRPQADLLRSLECGQERVHVHVGQFIRLTVRTKGRGLYRSRSHGPVALSLTTSATGRSDAGSCTARNQWSPVSRSTGVGKTAWNELSHKRIHRQVALSESGAVFDSVVVDFSSEGTD